jgi:EAL domain-containing protein (putative c-di-GMP-specific phosphodiesterase class I)/ActR/RegA family two-component response regulator
MMRALIVDDDLFSLKLLERQLTQARVEAVLTCDNALAALGLVEAEAERVDLIFVDLNMPGMDGVEFLRCLAERHFRGGLVLVSGEDTRVLQSVAALARAHRLRLLAALTKPVAPERIAELIEAVPGSSGTTVIQAVPKFYQAVEVADAIGSGQLVNYYQPQVVLATAEVAGVETLVRWQHPEDGLVFPDRFIPVIEAGGLSDRLANAVLAGALRDARRWSATGLHLRLAINVAMDNLTELGFPDEVAQALAAAGVPTSGLVLEITESQATRDRLKLLDISSRLRLKHIGLSIDDFGTGFSSLAQLRDIPFDELKLDRDFVHGVGRDPALRAMVQANVGMARELQLRTVAEGVEDRSDWDCLRDLGCECAQGYFIGRPMPAEALPGWIAQWQERRLDLLAGAR